MEIIIVATGKKLNSILRLEKESISLGHCAKIVSLRDIKSFLYKQKNFSNLILLNRVSGISYNDDDLVLYNSFPALKVFNESRLVSIFRDKALQFLFFKDKKLSTIDTVDLQNISKQESENFFRNNPHQSFLAKPIRSNQAKGIRILTRDKAQLFSSKQSLDMRYIIQPFIEKKCEWRILIINKEIFSIMKKVSSDPFEILNCESSILQEIPFACVTKGLSSLIKKISERVDLFIMAIDILETINQEYMIIEINNIPGLKHVEKTSQKNIAKIMISKLVEASNSLEVSSQDK